jgi:hypothetical protein
MAWEKKVSQKDAVKAFFVLDAGSKIDLEASTAKYRQAALGYLASQEAEESLVTQCMSEVFDTYRGASLNLDFVKSQTVQRLGIHNPSLKEPSLYITLAKRVEDVLHSLTGEDESKPYSMRKGKNGGFSRKADQAFSTKA